MAFFRQFCLYVTDYWPYKDDIDPLIKSPKYTHSHTAAMGWIMPITYCYRMTASSLLPTIRAQRRQGSGSRHTDSLGRAIIVQERPFDL
ncbi:hypothetical protein Acife_2320 [Acidithiobacillus ferrivorans SS3]|uniref:Uncharacterized protein n=1 Tax=Acidithiobacillus ferrivorans SS3 TaxID=743299 RepID=G0JP14_9PROT|nr:hypothetical protein Acife_2320 [Acidithiobacillus ferrivorans SS3]